MSNTNRVLVLGDIHGELDKLNQVLQRAGYKEEDLVIQIGDLVDRGPEPLECMYRIGELKHRILIKGNHDQAFEHYIRTGKDLLGGHGANGTAITIYKWKMAGPMAQDYVRRFLHEQREYYIDSKHRLFVHGGFNRNYPIAEVDVHDFMWDRKLVNKSMSCTGDQKLAHVDNFKEIFIGHTPTTYWDITTPISRGGVTNVDTGCGKGGKLTIMDVNTKEFWQSD